MYSGMRADVVFLGIGLLGKQSDAFVRDYWREVVQTTGAKIVVPVHWDDFTVSLDRPLRQTGPLFDKVKEALAAIGELAAAGQMVWKSECCPSSKRCRCRRRGKGTSCAHFPALCAWG